MTAKKNATTTKKTVSSTGTAPASNTTTTPSVGLASLVNELSAQLDQAEARLGPEAPSLTGTEKKRAAKARKGFEKILSAIAPIVQQHGLESSSLSATAMTERMAHAQTLQPLQSRLGKMKKRVDDEVFNAQGDAWQMGLQFYSLLKSRAKGDGELATSLEPVTKMFAYRHPTVKAAKPTKVQTRAKKELKSATALAERHGVPLGGTVAAAAVQTAPAPAVATVNVAPAAGAAGAGVASPVVAAAGATAPVVTTVASVAPPAAPAAGGGAERAGVEPGRGQQYRTTRSHAPV